MTTTELSAAELDAADPLAGYRSRFLGADDPAVVAYLDGNSLGRPVAATRERLAAFVEQAWGRRLIRGWDETWMAGPQQLGDRIGAVALGAAAGQTVIGDSTSVLLYKLIRAAVDLDPARDEIVIDRANFPTDRFLVEGIAAERGLTIRWLDPAADAGLRPAEVAAVVGPRTALVVASHVAFRSGFLADLPAITRVAHDAGALVLWDLCHSAGVVPTDLDADDVDLAVGCTYKYLNGGPGSPAFGYVAERWQGRLRQPIWGWIGAHEPFAMADAYRPADGIRRFLTGTPSVIGMQPIADMLDLIAEAGLPAIRAKSVALTEFALRLVDDRLAPLGATPASPRDAAERGSHVTVDHPAAGSAIGRLWDRGVIPDFRPPDGLRLGLSPLSTSFAEVEHGIDAIAEELEAGS